MDEHDRVVAFLEYMLTTLDGCAQILVDEAEKAFNEVKLNGNEVASFFLRFEEAAAVLKYIASKMGAGPLMVIDTEVDLAVRSKPA